METNHETPKPKQTEFLLDNPDVVKFLHTGVRQFNTIVMESNSKSPDANIDDTLDNLTLMDEALTDLDEFSEYVVREQMKKNGDYHVNIAPRASLHEKDGKPMFDFANGPIKEVQIKISGVYDCPPNTPPDQVMAKSGYGIEVFVSEANYSKDESTGEGKVKFTKQDGIKMNVRHDGYCYMQGRKYAGELGYTTERPLRIDTLPNMAPVIQGVQGQIKAMKIF